MTTQAVADTLIALLKQSKNVEAYKTLYAQDAECIEADSKRSRSGLARLTADMQTFADAHEFHYIRIDGPLVVGETFAVALTFRATPRAGGASFDVPELGVYTVRGGKIIREQFHYDVG
jgi:hypothetical protein